MNRPKSIEQFDWIYLAVIALGVIGLALSWDDVTSSVQVQQTIARFGMAMIYVPMAIGVLIQLLLWYFVARRGSLVAKWIFVILTGLGVVWSALGLFGSDAAGGVAAIINVVAIVLQIIAITLLFRPDAKPWFGETAPAA